VDTVSRRKVLEKMRQAGCTTVSFGVESGSPEMLKRIKKGITLEQVVHAMQLCRDCGIDPHASFILGLPGETETTLAQTLAFGEHLKAMGVSHGFHILAPFPGTDVRERVDEYDLQILSDDWRQYHANRAIIRTAGVSPETMDASRDRRRSGNSTSGWGYRPPPRRRAGTAEATAGPWSDWSTRWSFTI
jgi:anaerobic magnesium-protoporphyrin IX monomethyl ester cyclase